MSKEATQKDQELLFDFGAPPRRKVNCPIIDAHTHVDEPENTRKLVEAAQSYGVTKMLGITTIQKARALREAFPNLFEFAFQLNYENRSDAKKFRDDNFAILDEAFKEGLKVVKYWFKPQFNAEYEMKLDDERLAPIFDKIGELGMACLVHIADPDMWFYTTYRDVDRYGSKAETYVQLENVLRNHRNVNIMGAHLGGDPENLDHISQLLDDHPNYAIDTSATKWITRELSLKPEESSAFFIKYSDRIIFGSDLVVRKEVPQGHYESRYWTQQMLWETSYRGDSPIYDPDACGPVHLSGIDLPEDVIEKVYCKNAERHLKIKA